MTTPPAITIPRLPDESSRAYDARVRYVTAGAGRDLRTLAQQLDKSLTLVGRWSSQFGWVKSAADYDQAVAYVTIQEASAAYRRDLEDHRKRYQQSGRALHGVAVEMLSRLRAADVEYTPAALATIARALTVAADLEAHALRVADLLPRLGGDADGE